jgi:hypothetical protein
MDLDRGNKIVSAMSRKEFMYRIILNGTAFLLLIAIIAVLIAKIIS